MRVHLVAVQAALSEGPYGTAERFAAWTMRLAREAVAGVPDDGSAVLLAFPEAIGMPLLLTLGRHPWVEGREGVVALAPDAEREAIVRASVELPDRAAGHGPVRLPRR